MIPGSLRICPRTLRQKSKSRFQDYMGVPATSEWELETWNYLLVYPPASNVTPSHLAMYHYHRYTDYTPAFSGNDEHLLFATPLNGNDVASKNPYTEWANMHAVVGMAPAWTNRWRSPTLNSWSHNVWVDRERLACANRGPLSFPRGVRNRLPAEASAQRSQFAGGGPSFGCPALETSFQLVTEAPGA